MERDAMLRMAKGMIKEKDEEIDNLRKTVGKVYSI